ncbi:transcription factor/nuclear export subunit protein 2-domain-containing protein [Podospora fimiseda]|uniref:THO complex subunit 2 n=1 Tax=Podospora fimiseda TaxID=252190 RepID=A0AAN7H5W4_9PEZI|nr:transcription factor/nuclear export subunit protein 2-domain-containing protein [Podospora fimiseda]
MPPKRKRSDRGPSDSGPSRPSPHKPQETSMGQHDRQQQYDRSFDGRSNHNHNHNHHNQNHHNRNSGGGGGGGCGGRNNNKRAERRESSQSYAPTPSSSSAQGPASPTFTRPPSASSQKQFSTMAPTATPAAIPSPSAPPTPIQPHYLYSIITESAVSRWHKGARQDIISHGIQSREDEDVTEVATIFQEIIYSVVNNRLRGADAGAVIKEILGPEPSDAEREVLEFDPHELFLDMVCDFVDVESGPIRSQVRDFMLATEISPDLMRQVIDHDVLIKLELVRSSFQKMSVRNATNLLYRQASYNLLREETEGWAKLVTEVFTTCTAEPGTSAVVQDTFNKVMGLIGTFDLHPGRVLDVTIDVFAAILVKQFRFFIKFLRVSSWWPRNQIKPATSGFIGGLPAWALPEHSSPQLTPEQEEAIVEERLKRDIAFWERAREVKLDAYFELGGRRLSAADQERLLNGVGGAASPETQIDQEWIKITKTLPPPGNRDAAQMLGFKLRFYASRARDSDDTLPANLLYLTALLIKVGFISLTDLWNHIWPPDDEMETFKAEKLKELEEKERENRPGAAQNALMKAGALPDDMAPPPPRRDAAPHKVEADSKNAEATDETKKAKKPDDQKVHLLKCLLTIGALPEALFIIGQHDWILQAFPDILALLHRILHHSIEVVYQKSRPNLKIPECPAKRVPDQDQTGVPKGNIRLTDPPPSKRPLRWPHPDKFDDSGSNYRFYWDEWADNIPVCQTVDDLFTLCDTLLNIVGVNIGLDASLMTKITAIGAKSLADDQSPENVARWLELLKRLLVPALSLGEPNSAVVDRVWNLLKRYPIQTRFYIYAEWNEGSISRLEPMRKAFARTKLETLAKLKRLSLTNISEMAKGLAKIAYPSPGVVCKVALAQIEAYSNFIEAFVECAKYFTDLGYDVLVWAILSSLGGQQRSRTQADSVLLTSRWLQALSRFSGKVFERYSNVDPSPILRYVHSQLLQGNSTDLVILKELIVSMGGVVSDIDFTDAQLRAMTGGELLRRETLINLGDKRSSSVRSSARLMKALSNSKLAGQLLINIAQYRQNAIYAEDGNARIKYLATVVDDAHQVLLQYLDLIRSNLDADTFNSLVPDITRLMRDFGLEANLAFLIRRSSIRWEVKSSSAKDSPSQAAKAAADGDGDVAMDGDETTPDIQGDNSPSSRMPESLAEALAPLIEEIPSVLPNQSWRYMSATGYVFFWSLSLGSLVFPQDSYQAENNRLKKLAEEVMRDRSDMSRAGMNKKQSKRSDALDRQKRLLKEQSEGLERFSKSRLHIGRHLNTWFPAGIAKADAASDALLEQCILPRLQLSPVDSEYCFRLIKFLHEFSTPNFKLMSLYDRLFNHNRLRAIIFTCTVREAEHLGRFLKHVLGDLSKWHGDKTAYEKEALGLKDVDKTRHYLGFATAFDADNKPTEFVEHDQFKELLFKWHKELNSALRACLNGTEWMHIRNAITVLKSVIDFFPAINFMADKFLEQLKTITEREAASKNAPESEQGHRVDLSVTAQTAYSELQKRKSKWILVQAFRPGVKDDPAPSSSGLRASAVDFKPGSRRSHQQEVEDGEVVKPTNKTSTPARVREKEPNLPKPPARELPRDSNSSSQKGTSNNASSGRQNNPRSIPLVPVNSGNRPEPAKFSTLPPGGHGLPNKPSLPIRPDVSFPRGNLPQPRHDRRDQQPPRESREYRDARDPRESHSREPHPRDTRDAHGGREPRDYRTPDTSRPERPRDFPSADRRQPDAGPRDVVMRDAGPRDVGRSSDREWPARGELPPRWNEHTAPPERDNRPSRDRSSTNSSRHDSRPTRDSTAPSTSSQNIPHGTSQDPPTHPDRARNIVSSEVDRPDIINPARAALINDSREPPSRSSSRDQPRELSSRSGPRDQLRERPTRTESPRRVDLPPANPPQPDNSRDDRHSSSRHRHSDHHTSSRDGHGESSTPSHPRADRRDGQGETSTPTHPRSDRKTERDERPTGPRDSSFGGQSRQDPDHGRLNQQDPNYGRLNPIPSVVDMPPGPPSGPRGRGGRNPPRMQQAPGPTAPPMRQDNNRPSGPEPTRAPSPERHPPTGPAAGRNQRNRNQYDNKPANTPPQAAPTAPGVHPDRMRHISRQQANSQSPAPPPQAPSVPTGPANPPTGPSGGLGIHPDRLNQISATPTGPGSHNRHPMNTPDRPSMSNPNSGPRPAPPNINTDVATPTGPAAGNDRMRPGGRQLRGIQSTLDKASMDNARGPGLRNSRSRTNLAGSDAQILAGSSPVTTPVHERPPPLVDSSSHRDSSSSRGDRGPYPPPPPPPSRPEPIQVINDSRDRSDNRNGGDDYGSTRTENDRSRRDQHRSDRSNRASRRSSRERSPGGSGRDRETKDYRDSRDRRSGASDMMAVGGSVRDDSRRSGGGVGSSRDMAAPPPPPPPSSRDQNHHRGMRTDAIQLSGGGQDSGGRNGGRSGGGGGGNNPSGQSGSGRDSRGPRMGDDMRGGGDRKRRNEGVNGGVGGGGMDSGHQDKRPRRG